MQISHNLLFPQILHLELYQPVKPASNPVNCIKRLLFELMKLPILSFKFFELLELVIKLLMEGMKHSGLEGQRATPDCENADRQYSLHHEHLPLSAVSNFNYESVRKH